MDTLARMRQLIGTTAQWSASDIVIGSGEFAVEVTAAGDRLFKIGDGVRTFSALPYSTVTQQALIDLGNSVDGRLDAIEGAFGMPGGTGDFAVLLPFLDDQGKVIAALGRRGEVMGAHVLIGLGTPDTTADYTALGAIADTAGKVWVSLRRDGRIRFTRDNEATHAGDYAGAPLLVRTDQAGALIDRINGDGTIWMRLADDAIDYIAGRMPMPGGVPDELFLADDVVPYAQVYSALEEGRAATYAYRVGDPVVAVAQAEPPCHLEIEEGQSNALGLAGISTPNVITAPPYPHRALTMVGGQWGPAFPSSASGSAPASAYNTALITDLLPCAEGGGHETKTSAALRLMQSLDTAEGIEPPLRLGFVTGLGATAIASFLKGQPFLYDNDIAVLKKAIEQARSYGVQRFVCYTRGWDQGEGDWPATGGPTYVSRWATYRADKEADVRALTGQKEPVWHVVRAVCAKAVDTGLEGTPGIYNYLTMMQGIRTTVSHCDYFLTGTTYGMDGGQHFRSAGNDVRGEYFGKARRHVAQQIKRAVAAGIDPFTLTIASELLTPGTKDIRTSLYVSAAARVGNVVTLDLRLPFDSSTVIEDLVTLGDGNDPARNIVKGIRQTAGGGNVTAVALTNPSAGVYKLAVTSSVAGPGTLVLGETVSAALGGTRSSAYSVFVAPSTIDSIARPGTKLDNWIIPFTIDYI